MSLPPAVRENKKKSSQGEWRVRPRNCRGMVIEPRRARKAHDGEFRRQLSRYSLLRGRLLEAVRNADHGHGWRPQTGVVQLDQGTQAHHQAFVRVQFQTERGVV